MFLIYGLRKHLSVGFHRSDPC